MKIYTKTGDRGQTGLIGGKRVSKASLRIEAYGSVDELNSASGVVLNQLEKVPLHEKIRRIQNDLHLVCADLADPNLAGSTPRVSAAHVAALEKECDELEARLPALRQFILPGGAPAAAQLHWARTVARRAERRVVELAAQEEVNPYVIQYLNRLSDLLFLMARWVNVQADVPELHPEYR